MRSPRYWLALKSPYMQGDASTRVASFLEFLSVLKNSLVAFSERRLGTQSPSFAVFWSGFGCFRPSSGAQVALATTFQQPEVFSETQRSPGPMEGQAGAYGRLQGQSGASPGHEKSRGCYIPSTYVE